MAQNTKELSGSSAETIEKIKENQKDIVLRAKDTISFQVLIFFGGDKHI